MRADAGIETPSPELSHSPERHPSRSRRIGLRWGSIGLASLVAQLAVLGASASAPAQTVELAGEGRLNVRADGDPLIIVLRKLEAVVPIEQILLDPAVDGTRVSVALERVTFKEAIEEILAAAEVNHIVWGKNHGPFRIFAGSRHLGRPVSLAERPAGLDRSANPGGTPPPIDPVPVPVPVPPDTGATATDPQGAEAPARARPAVSGEAHLRAPPGIGGLAQTLILLGAGFVGGAWLVGPRPMSSAKLSGEAQTLA